MVENIELNGSSDPFAKSGYKFIDILMASITKLKYIRNIQMNKNIEQTDQFYLCFLLLFFELLNPGRDEQAYLLASFSQSYHRKSIYLKHLR